MTAVADVLLPRDLFACQLFGWLGVGDPDERETLIAVIDSAQRLAADAFLPHYRKADIEEPRLDADGVHILPAIHRALALYAELGPFGASFAEELGGLGLPFAVSLAVYGNFAAASISTGAYTRDFDVEQLWRDNRLNPIHEGTAGIQAVDLLGRKILGSDSHAVAMMRARSTATAGQTEHQLEWKPMASALLEFWDHVDKTITGLRAVDGPEAFDDATLFRRTFGHGVVAWPWLDQALHGKSFPPARWARLCLPLLLRERTASSGHLARDHRRPQRYCTQCARRDFCMMGLVAALRANVAITRRLDWLAVDQPLIDRFAETTSDHQFIHVDPVRAAATRTVAHGLLTLPLLPRLFATVIDTPTPTGKLVVNYGFDRVRFVHPVRCGSRIRGAFTLLDIEKKHPPSKEFNYARSRHRIHRPHPDRPRLSRSLQYHLAANACRARDQGRRRARGD